MSANWKCTKWRGKLFVHTTIWLLPASSLHPHALTSYRLSPMAISLIGMTAKTSMIFISSPSQLPSFQRCHVFSYTLSESVSTEWCWVYISPQQRAPAHKTEFLFTRSNNRWWLICCTIIYFSLRSDITGSQEMFLFLWQIDGRPFTWHFHQNFWTPFNSAPYVPKSFS